MKKLVNLTFLFFFALTLFQCKTIEKSKNNSVTPTKTTTKSISPLEKQLLTAFFIDATKERMLGNYSIAIMLYNKCAEKDPTNDAAFYELARIYNDQLKETEALPLAEKAVALDPTNEWYQLLLGELYEKLGKYAKAATVYKKLAEQYPDKIDYFDSWGASLILDSKYKEAINVYNLLEKKIGITEALSLQKEKIYLHLNDFNKAVAEIETLIIKFPEESKYHSILAELYIEKKMYEKAYEQYQQVLTADPNNKYIHISLAEYYRKIGDNDKSFEELKLGFANPDLDIDSKIEILLAYYTATEIVSSLKEQAFALTKVLVETHPNEAKAHSMYADFLYRDRKLEETKIELKKVIALDSNKYVIWETLLLVESDLKDFSSLVNEAERAIKLFPEQPLLYLLCGMGYYQLEQFRKGEDVLQKGIKKAQINSLMLSQFYTYLGDTYNKLNDNNASDEAYQKAIDFDSTNAYAMNNFSYYLSVRNYKLEKAEKLAEKANKLEPNNGSYQDTYGWVLYKMGKYEEAKSWVARAIISEPTENDIILEHYGDILYQLGDKDNALKYWEKALKAGKGSEYLNKKIRDQKLYE